LRSKSETIEGFQNGNISTVIVDEEAAYLQALKVEVLKSFISNLDLEGHGHGRMFEVY